MSGPIGVRKGREWPRWLLLGCLLLALSPAWAHKVVLGVWPDGADIEGEVGFSNGDLAEPGTRIEVLGPDGEPIGETRVTEDGLFRFTPTRAVPHRFRANLGAGHVAEVALPLDEMPEIATSGEAESELEPAPAVAVAASGAGLDAPALKDMIATAVRREVKPLRRELAALKEKLSIQQVLGGLGYIAGITGVLFFVYARRERRGG